MEKSQFQQLNRLMPPTALAAGLLLVLTAPSRSRGGRTDRPNVIIIYADDVGYGDPVCYGADLVETPNIDRHARQGCRFTDAHSVSAVCSPSRYALLTGEYPFRQENFAPIFMKVGLMIDTTLAALTGCKLGPGDAPDSYNMLTVLLNETDTEVRDHAVLAAFREDNLALRKDNWVYIGAQGGGGFSGTEPGDHNLGGPPALEFAGQENSDVEDGKILSDAPQVQLYNLETDLSQRINVAREHPELVEELQGMLEEIRQNKQTRPSHE